jgi:hypothetical protein
MLIPSTSNPVFPDERLGSDKFNPLDNVPSGGNALNFQIAIPKQIANIAAYTIKKTAPGFLLGAVFVQVTS